MYNSPYVVMVSVSVRKVIEIMRFEIQLTHVAIEFPVLRAHSGYISALIVHGIGPIPGANIAISKIHRRQKLKIIIHQFIKELGDFQLQIADNSADCAASTTHLRCTFLQ